MLLTDIVLKINSFLAGENLTYSELKPLLDATIDEINTYLDAKFPVFSELDSTVEAYTFFPDKYIRNTVIPGVVYKFYTIDEEGLAVAPGFQADYERGLFYMMRDYTRLVPVEYQQNGQGYITITDEESSGITIDNSNFAI